MDLSIHIAAGVAAYLTVPISLAVVEFRSHLSVAGLALYRARLVTQQFTLSLFSLAVVLIGLIGYGQYTGWKRDTVLDGLWIGALFLLVPVVLILTVLYFRELLRAPKLMAASRARSHDLPVMFARENFDAIGLSAPYVSFFFNVENRTNLTIFFAGNEGGAILFVDVPWRDSWELIVEPGHLLTGIPAGEVAEIEIQQRVPPDLMGTFAGYRGKPDMPLDFSYLRIPVESEQVGPFKAKFDLTMPSGWTDIAVPERASVGFGPLGSQPDWGRATVGTHFVRRPKSDASNNE